GTLRDVARSPNASLAQSRFFLAGEALAPVSHRYDQLIVTSLRRHRDGGTGGGIFRGVVQNLPDRLLQQYRIDIHQRQIAGQPDVELVHRKAPRSSFDRRVDDIGGIAPLPFRADTLRADAGGIEQVLNVIVDALTLVGGD